MRRNIHRIVDTASRLSCKTEALRPCPCVRRPVLALVLPGEEEEEEEEKAEENEGSICSGSATTQSRSRCAS